MKTDEDIAGIALDVTQQLTGYKVSAIKAALGSEPEDDSDEGLVNDYNAVHGALLEVARPLRSELKKVQGQRDDELAGRRAAEHALRLLRAEHNALLESIASTTAQAEASAGRIGGGA